MSGNVPGRRVTGVPTAEATNLKHTDAEKLAGILREIEPANLSVALADMFAVGCYLHMKGEHTAGSKVCRSVLKVIGNTNRKTYFENLMSSLTGNEKLFASQVGAHLEVKRLFSEHGADDNLP